MIIVAGEMVMEPSIMADFEQAVAAMRGDVLREAGCLSYALLVQDAAAGIVTVLEMWEDDHALAVHLKQPWILDFLTRFGGHLQSSSVQIHDVARIRQLSDL